MTSVKGAKSSLPTGWRSVRLGNVTSIVSGTTPRSDNPSYWNGDIVWITPTDLGKLTEPYIRNSDRKITKIALDSHNLTLVPPRSVVLSSRAPIGHLGIAEMPLCTNQGCKSFIPNDDVNEWFLYYALKLSIWKLQQLGSGATFAEVSKAQLESFDISLPSLEEQRRITKILGDRLAAVQAMSVAVKGRQAATDDLLMAHLRDVFEGSEAANWKSTRLGEVLIPHKEMIHPGDRESGTTQFVGLEHLEPHTGRRFGSLTLDLSRLTGRKPTFREGQIVYGYLRPYLNKVWIAEFDGCSSVDQYAFDVRSDTADARFVAWFMRSSAYLRRSEVVTTTGQLPRIGTEKIAAVEIGMPDLDRQRALADEMDAWSAQWQRLRDLVRAESDAVNNLPKALLRQAFAGEL